MNNLYDLLKLLNSQSSSSFQELVKLSIDKIKYVEASINLNNEQSICDGKGVLLFVKNNFIEESNELDNNQLKSDMDRQISELYENTLTAVDDLFPILYSYQLEAIKNNPQGDSNSSSLPSSSIDLEHSEDQQSMEINKPRFQTFQDDDEIDYIQID